MTARLTKLLAAALLIQTIVTLIFLAISFTSLASVTLNISIYILIESFFLFIIFQLLRGCVKDNYLDNMTSLKYIHICTLLDFDNLKDGENQKASVRAFLGMSNLLD